MLKYARNYQRFFKKAPVVYVATNGAKKRPQKMPDVFFSVYGAYFAIPAYERQRMGTGQYMDSTSFQHYIGTESGVI